MIIAGHDWVRKIRSFILNRIFFIIFLLPYLFFSFVTYKDFGITLDEPIEYNFGQMLYARNFGRDPLLMRDFAVAGDDSREIWAYNHFHTMLLYIVNGSGSIEIYHLLNLLFGILGFYLAFELVFLVSHNPVLSLLGPVFLFFTPRFLGDLPGNVKDPVFAIYYLLALTAIAFIPKYKSSILRVVCVGITIGLSAAMRVLGYGLIPIYGLFLFKHLINQKTSLQFIYKSLFIELTAITLMAIIVHAIEMPFVASNPLLNLPQLFKLGVAYPWDGEMLYLGKIIHTGSIPWHYIFVWAGITTPIFLLCTWFLSHLIWKLKEVQLFNFAIWFNILVYYQTKYL